MADACHLFAISCGSCAAVWAGDDRAHCGTCHETWDSVELFDEHRRGGLCGRPQALGVVATKNHIWRRRERGCGAAG